MIEDAFIALGGNPNLEGTISATKIQDVLKGEFQLNNDLEVLYWNNNILENIKENMPK